MRTTTLLILFPLFCLAAATPAAAQAEADVTPLPPEEEAEVRPADDPSEADPRARVPSWLGAFNESFTAESERLRSSGLLRPADVAPSDPEVRQAQALDRAEVADAATPISLPGSASTIRDLLSFLVAGTDIGDLSDEGPAIVLTLNPNFFDWGRGQGSGKVTLREPEVSEALLMALPEDVRDARKTSLGEDLDELGDVEVALTWARETSRIGRDPSDHEELTQHLARLLDSDIAEVVEMQGLLATLDAGRAPSVAQATAAGREAVRGLAALQATYDRTGYFRSGELISNQPQLYVDFTGRFRDELAGQDELAVSITWEGGAANVNGLLRECVGKGSGTRSWSQQVQAVTPSCYTRFVEEANPEWSRRWKLSAEYSETQGRTVELPDDDLSLDLDSANTLRVTGGFGFDLKPLPELGNSPPRLDLEATYEEVSNSEIRNDDRLVGSLTFTQKMSDSSAATLSLVYANKPELLGEVDEELSARVGLKFSIDSGDDKKPAQQ